MIHASFNCIKEHMPRCLEILERLGFDRHKTFNQLVTIKDVTDEEAPRLFACCMQLKQYYMIDEFHVEWTQRR